MYAPQMTTHFELPVSSMAVGESQKSAKSVNAAPAVNAALSALVITGAAVDTVNVKAWLASGAIPFAALIVNG